MTTTDKKPVPKLNDADVIRAFKSVISKHKNAGFNIQYQTLYGALTEEEVEKVRKLAGYNLTTVSLSEPPLHWTWKRTTGDANSPNPLHDALTTTWHEQQGPVDRDFALTVTASLDIALSRPIASVNPDIAMLAPHSDVIHALESAAASVLAETAEYRQSLDKAYAEKENALNERLAQDRERELNRIEQERQRVDSDLSARSSALDERQQSLDGLQKRLDDRNNTHVRREIRASLLNLAKERLENFSISRQTRFQYVAVHVVSLLSLGTLLAGVYRFSSLIVPDANGVYSATTIALAVKSALLAAAAIALGSWYLGWLNRWLQRIADAEFKLQQFRLDIERASWLAETVLEWKSTSEEPFPDLLATRLSTGLFTSTPTDFDDPKTPANHLAEALFGAASSAKLKLGDQEVSFDRKAIRNLEKHPQA